MVSKKQRVTKKQKIAQQDAEILAKIRETKGPEMTMGK